MSPVQIWVPAPETDEAMADRPSPARAKGNDQGIAVVAGSNLRRDLYAGNNRDPTSGVQAAGPSLSARQRRGSAPTRRSRYVGLQACLWPSDPHVARLLRLTLHVRGKRQWGALGSCSAASHRYLTRATRPATTRQPAGPRGSGQSVTGHDGSLEWPLLCGESSG